MPGAVSEIVEVNAFAAEHGMRYRIGVLEREVARIEGEVGDVDEGHHRPHCSRYTEGCPSINEVFEELPLSRSEIGALEGEHCRKKAEVDGR